LNSDDIDRQHFGFALVSFFVCALIAEGQRYTAALISVDPLFQCGIIQLLMKTQGLQHLVLLSPRWVKAICDFALDGFHDSKDESVTMKNQDLNTLYHCIYDLKYHLVLVTKCRRKVINKVILARLHEHFSRLLKSWECEFLEFNGEADHVHLLISLNPKAQSSKLVNNLKTVTSRLIRKEFSEHVSKFYLKPIFWSRTYCLLTVGGAPLSVLKQYIENQEEIEA
jgi:putative transposase